MAATLNTAKRFVAYYYCNGSDLSLGISLHWQMPNIEIHLPFGFVRIGWVRADQPQRNYYGHPYRFLYRHWGWD